MFGYLGPLQYSPWTDVPEVCDLKLSIETIFHSASLGSGLVRKSAALSELGTY